MRQTHSQVHGLGNVHRSVRPETSTETEIRRALGTSEGGPSPARSQPVLASAAAGHPCRPPTRGPLCLFAVVWPVRAAPRREGAAFVPCCVVSRVWAHQTDDLFCCWWTFGLCPAFGSLYRQDSTNTAPHIPGGHTPVPRGVHQQPSRWAQSPVGSAAWTPPDGSQRRCLLTPPSGLWPPCAPHPRARQPFDLQSRRAPSQMLAGRPTSLCGRLLRSSAYWRMELSAFPRWFLRVLCVLSIRGYVATPLHFLNGVF